MANSNIQFEPDIKRINDSLSSVYHCFVYYSDPPLTLLDALCRELPDIDINSWPQRIEWGGVYINGKVCYDLSRSLQSPMKLEYYQPKVPVDKQADLYPSFSKDWIVYEDNDLFVVYKPAGLSCQKAKEQQKISLYQFLSDHYGRPIHLPSRLDFSTSGLVLCSHNPKSFGLVQELFVERKILKKYLLLIDHEVDWKEISIDQKISRDLRHPVLRKGIPLDHPESEVRGKSALTEFKLIDSYQKENNHYSVLSAKPVTGRTHQIRVHAKYGLGQAIVGDNFYSGSHAPELCLSSVYMSFRHPVSKKQMELSLSESLMPEWMNFDWIEKVCKG